MASPIQQRNLLTIALLLLITFGFYFLYWLYKTKEEINKLGGTIPTFLFVFIPFLNIYFFYRYAQDFITYVYQKEDTPLVIFFFLLLLFVPFVAPFIIQNELNNFTSHPLAGFLGKIKRFFK